MNFTYCILFCLVATIMDGCNGEDGMYALPKRAVISDDTLTTTLEQCKTNFRISREKVALLLSQMISLLYYPPLVYNNKKYFISNFPHKNVSDAMGYCTAQGGYLAEIDDNDEYKALQKYVLNSPPDIVVIGGSDAAKEGTWLFQRTGQPLKFFDWVQGQPDNGYNNENCLNLWKINGARMNDLPCNYRSPDDRFMCELPNKV